MNQKSKYLDNGDGTVTDTDVGLMWTREDSWQTEAKWFTWDEAKEFANHLGYLKFAGHNDWRLPSQMEATSLYDPEKENKDKYGSVLHLDPVFPEGSLPTLWIHEDNTGSDGYILDLRNGEIRVLYKSKSGRMAARAVRNSSV